MADAKLEANLLDLLGFASSRVATKLPPVRRTYIRKAGWSSRWPLGIPTFEDKLAQTGDLSWCWKLRTKQVLPSLLIRVPAWPIGASGHNTDFAYCLHEPKIALGC